MAPSAAADEKRQDEEDLDRLLIALNDHMETLMTLAKDAVAFASDGTGKSRKRRPTNKR